MKQKASVHKIKARDLLHSLNNFTSIRISLPADELQKFAREAEVDGKSPEKLVAQLIGRYLRQCGRHSRL